jgi:hypothetical protein
MVRRDYARSCGSCSHDSWWLRRSSSRTPIPARDRYETVGRSGPWSLHPSSKGATHLGRRALCPALWTLQPGDARKRSRPWMRWRRPRRQTARREQPVRGSRAWAMRGFDSLDGATGIAVDSRVPLLEQPSVDPFLVPCRPSQGEPLFGGGSGVHPPDLADAVRQGSGKAFGEPWCLRGLSDGTVPPSAHRSLPGGRRRRRRPASRPGRTGA